MPAPMLALGALRKNGQDGLVRWLATSAGLAAIVIAVGARLGPGPALADEPSAMDDLGLTEADALAQELGIPFRAVRFADFAVVSDLPSDRLHVHGETLAQAAADFIEAISMLGIEAQTPAHPLTVVMFSDHREFVEFAARADGVDAHWMGGYYASGTNRAVMYDDVGGPEFVAASGDGAAPADIAEQAARATREKIRHEVAHLLAFNCGVQSRSIDHPLWFTEGLAESFARGALSGASPARRTARHEDDPVRAFYEQSRLMVDAMIDQDPSQIAALLRAAPEGLASSPAEFSAVSAVGGGARLEPTPP